jgi:hypothetical protein
MHDMLATDRYTQVPNKKAVVQSDKLASKKKKRKKRYYLVHPRSISRAYSPNQPAPSNPPPDISASPQHNLHGLSYNPISSVLMGSPAGA